MTATYQDAIDHLIDYLGGTPADAAVRDAKRAIQEAYRDLTNAFRWSYLLAQGRLITSMPLADGTIAYSAATNVATLDPLATGAVWPSWAAGGYLRIGFVASKCVVRISDTEILLDDAVRPADDLPAGTEYKFYRDSYLLPADFVSADQALYERNFGGMEFVHPREWLFEERFLFAEGVPQCYTVTGDRLYPGRLVMRLCPLPSEHKTIDFLYHRRPRGLRVAQLASGTVATTQGSAGIAGTGTAWDATMVGALLRVSATLGLAPTAIAGKNPADFETRIVAVPSATGLVAADPAPFDLTGVPYTISDPIDVEEGAMLNAFWRGIEAHIAINRALKDKPSAAALYKVALAEARAADSRSFAGRSVGDHWPYRQRLRDMPIDLNRLD